MSAVIAPPRSLAQQMEALALANEIRMSRARLKRDISAGRVRARDVLEHPPGWAATMKVHPLLLAIPKLGRVKVNRILGDCRVSPSKTLGGLSDRQRSALVAALARYTTGGEGC